MDRLKAQDITFFNRGPQATTNQDASYKSKIGEQFDINGNIKSITVFLITIGDEIDNLLEVQKNAKKKESNKKGATVVSTTINIEGRPIDIRVKDMRYLMDDMQGICKQIIKYEKKLPECIKGVIIIMNKCSRKEKSQQQSLKDFLKIWNQQKQEDCPLNIIISVPGEQFSANTLQKMNQLCKKQKKILIQLNEPIKLHQMMEKLYVLKCSQYGIEEEFKKIIKNHQIAIQKLKSRKFKLEYSIIHKIDEDWKQRIDAMVAMISSLLSKYESTLKLIQQEELEQNKATDRFVYLNKSLQQISTIMEFINEDIYKYKKNESKISQNNSIMEEKQEEIESLTNQINGKEQRWRLKLKILSKIKQKLENQLKDNKIKVDSIRQKYKNIIEELQKQLNIFQTSTKQISEVNERFIEASSQSSTKSKVKSLDFDIENQLDTSQIAPNQTDEEQNIYKNKLGYKMKFQEKSMKQFYKKLSSILGSFKIILCFDHQNLGLSQKQPMCLLIQSFLQQKLESISLEEEVDFIKRNSVTQTIKSNSGIKDTPGETKSSIMPNSAMKTKSKSNQKEQQNKYVREKIKAAVKEAKDIIQRYDVDKIEDIRYNMKYLQWQISIQQYFLTILKDNWEVLKSKEKDKKN